jgi:hypothetical protein
MDVVTRMVAPKMSDPNHWSLKMLPYLERVFTDMVYVRIWGQGDYPDGP